MSDTEYEQHTNRDDQNSRGRSVRALETFEKLVESSGVGAVCFLMLIPSKYLHYIHIRLYERMNANFSSPSSHPEMKAMMKRLVRLLNQTALKF